MGSQLSVVSIKSSYRDLKVWRKAIELTKAIYTHTENFPKREHFGLSSQMRRAAVSVASNIAEGATRHSTKEFVHFLAIARGSLAELSTQIEIAYEIGFIDEVTNSQLMSAISEISKMLAALKSKLTTDN